MQFKKRESKRLSLEITPLIDVIFLLLIFFMVSTTFITSPGIRVNLPEASVKAKPEVPKSVEIVITDASKLYLNGRSVTKKTLKTSLIATHKQVNAESLIIKADGEVKHELVVFVMDIAKQVGIHKLSIATTPKETS